MARDDYFVIVYQVLKYLYECLKEGKRADGQKLSAEYLRINQYYWQYIFISLSESGFIKNLEYVQTKDGMAISKPEDVLIAPPGIQHLFENSLFEKVKRVLKDANDAMPLA